jgi:hydrogenase maturation protein HypF
MTKKDKKGRALRIVVFGVVQGVGFRPFVYRLAHQFQYKGWVKNLGFGVEIHVEKQDKTDFKNFLNALQDEKPPLAQIEEIKIKPVPFQNLHAFKIEKSEPSESFVFISPDISVCKNCLQEIRDPQERRFHYPFTNCTDCGPRYTIVKTLPYDRKQTTMEGFKMCQLCASEYTNPLDRRYHAQPIACPICGPQVTLVDTKTGKRVQGGIETAASLLGQGKIVAIKGLGGFHLVCNALNPNAVSRLRKIKERKNKPLALMAADIATVEKYAFLNPEERSELLSARRPIVLLQKKKDIRGIAPHLDEMGFMLPYTPLHYLLLDHMPLVVATSSNKKDAPIIKDEAEGIEHLCDCILTHNRPIQMRADDSVLKVVGRKPLFLRRARGYVPYPQQVLKELKCPQHILALGGELKVTLSLYKNGYVVTSQFLGDMDEYQNYKYFEETLAHLSHLFAVKPEMVVSDLHPHFHTTRFAQKLGIPHLQVQHHFAHILAPLLEHKIFPAKKVLGVALDGYGYGEDGQAWGAEFLLADYSSFERLAHFKYVPLPGGDLAAKQPWRMAFTYLWETFGMKIPEVKALEKISDKRIKGLLQMIREKVNTPLTSSCGRLFDAVSFLVGISPQEVEFEAEAPMRLEALATIKTDETYNFSFFEKDFPWQISFSGTIKGVLKDLEQKIPLARISAKFHNTLAQVIVQVAEKARKERRIDTVVLAGGVFLNKKLLSKASDLLEQKEFNVIRPVLYSPNDESMSLGQIAFALAKLKGL